MDLEQLGAELRDHRRAIRMSGTELARRVGISPTYVWLIERARQRPGGEPSRPSEDVLAAWTRTLRMSPEDIQRMRDLAGYAEHDDLPPPLARSALRSRFPEPPGDAPAPHLLAESQPPSHLTDAAAPLPIAPMPVSRSYPASHARPDPVEIERRLVAATRRLIRQAEAAGRVDELAELFTSMIEWLEHRLDRRP